MGVEERREAWPKQIAGTGGAPWPVTQSTSSLGQSRSPSANLLSLHCPLQIPSRRKRRLSHSRHRASSRAVGYPCPGTGQKLDQIQVLCAQLMAETCQFVVPGLQLAGCSLNTSGSVSMVHSSSQHEWEACVIHQFAAIPSCSHRCCCPLKPETAEHIMHPAQSHPDPPKSFRHHCISTEGNLQRGLGCGTLGANIQPLSCCAAKGQLWG